MSLLRSLISDSGDATNITLLTELSDGMLVSPDPARSKSVTELLLMELSDGTSVFPSSVRSDLFVECASEEAAKLRRSDINADVSENIPAQP
jgi:hypothetical protein